MNKLDRQLDLEREMSGLGHTRYTEAVITGKDVPDPRHAGQLRHKNSARQATEETRTDYGRSLLAQSIDTVGGLLYARVTGPRRAGGSVESSVTVLLRTFLPESKPCEKKDSETMPRYQARLLAHLNRQTESEKQSMRVVAFIGLSTVINALSTQVKVTATEARIGSALESELKFRFFEKVNPALFDKVFGDISRREGNFERRRAIMSHSMKTDSTGKAAAWVPIAHIELLKLGHLVLDTIVKNTTLVAVKTIRKARSKVKEESLLVATDSTLELMRERLDQSGIRNPVFLPALCSPKKWVTPLMGGYYSAFEELAPVRMVKIASKKRELPRLLELNEARHTMPLVFTAINAVQATPWKINRPVLAVMKDAWENSGLKIGKMPKRSSAETLVSLFPIEPFTEDMKEDAEKFVMWKRKAASVYQDRAVQSSRVIQMERIIAMAEKFEHEETLYFPTQLDFRGRMYAMPSFLNPQGTDCAKGLLTFARGCKLGKSGWHWLQIHVANMHGEDKISFDQREAWSGDNYDWIKACVTDPFANREWMEADKPWQFLAGAMELVAAVESGDYENYFSHLPVTVDGTCNGLQHFSAMLLDQEGAVSVNLQPSDVPNDIYQIVADKVKAKFAAMDGPLAGQWLQWGFDRKATKRAVMILPYSGTEHSAREYIRDYVKEREDKCTAWEDDFTATAFFSKHVWETIGETITSAGAAMKWLREVANEVTKAGQTIRWKTPVNFLVEQDNRDLDHFQVETKLGQRVRFRPCIVEDSVRLDPKAQRLGISPNFVHSLDANCLMLTVCRALDEGIEDFSMVHDSYGVLAGKMETLYMGLRQAFVDTYSNNVMLDFVKEATKGLPEKVQQKLIASMPKKGTFQLESVKDSKYFFA
jgi:DNA-directed RNA polymerase